MAKLKRDVLQAFCSELLKPVYPIVITFGAGHSMRSQSDKGGLVCGGNLMFTLSYAHGELPAVEMFGEGW